MKKYLFLYFTMFLFLLGIYPQKVMASDINVVNEEELQNAIGNPAIDNISITDDIVIGSDFSIPLDKTVIIRPQTLLSIDATVNFRNDGVIINDSVIQNFGEFTNNGLIENRIEISNYDLFVNDVNGVINNNLSFLNAYKMENKGVIKNDGNILNNNQFLNENKIVNNGVLLFTGNMINNGLIENNTAEYKFYGDATNSGTGTVNNVEYFVNYVLNGGSFNVGDPIGYYVSTGYSSDFTMPILASTEDVFEGWYDNSDFTGEPLQIIDAISSDKTFYAKWQSSQQTPTPTAIPTTTVTPAPTPTQVHATPTTSKQPSPNTNDSSNLAGQTSTSYYNNKKSPIIDVNGLDVKVIDLDIKFNNSEIIPISKKDENFIYVTIPTDAIDYLIERNENLTLEILSEFGGIKIPIHIYSKIDGFENLLKKAEYKREDVAMKIVISDESLNKEVLLALNKDISGDKVISVISNFDAYVIERKTDKVIKKIDRFNANIEKSLMLLPDIKELPEYFGVLQLKTINESFAFNPYKLVNNITVKILSKNNGTNLIVDNEIEYTDIEIVKWAVDSIKKVSANLLVKEFANDLFKPKDVVTRGEFINTIIQALDLYEADYTQQYTDVGKESKYYESIYLAKNNGLLEGFNKTEFKPNQAITREEMAMIMATIIKINNITPDNLVEDLEKIFVDYDQISIEHIEDVLLVYSCQVMEGIGNKEFSPKSQVTKSELSKGCLNLLLKMEYLG